MRRREKREKTDIGLKSFEQVKSSYAPAEYELLFTGIIPLDLVLGGGIPRGSFVELASPSGIGKSTLMAHVSKNLGVLGRRVDWWDYEHALTDNLKEQLGLKAVEEAGKFNHLELITYGDAEIVLETMIAKEKEFPDLIVVDSETSMLPDKLKDVSITNIEVGLKSRLASVFLQKYKGWARKNKVTFVFINQMRTKIGKMFNVQDDSAGGNALKFYCDIRLRMKRDRDITRREDTLQGEETVIYGIECSLWAIKNRNVRSHIEVPLPIIFGRGVSNLWVLKTILIAFGCVEPSGSYFKVMIPSVIEGQNVQGNKGLFALLKQHSEEITKYLVDNELLYLTKGEV